MRTEKPLRERARDFVLRNHTPLAQMATEGYRDEGLGLIHIRFDHSMPVDVACRLAEAFGVLPVGPLDAQTWTQIVYVSRASVRLEAYGGCIVSPEAEAAVWDFYPTYEMLLVVLGERDTNDVQVCYVSLRPPDTRTAIRFLENVGGSEQPGH
jgi:hypothetical protein